MILDQWSFRVARANRHARRVARNRHLAFVAILVAAGASFLLTWGILSGPRP